MTAAEEGVLLLCCRLGDPDCKPLTMPQFRDLGHLVRQAQPTGDPLRELTENDLTNLGYDREQAQRILQLLDREALLHRYLKAGREQDIYPLTRLDPLYPNRLAAQLHFACPAVLFYRGDLSLLSHPSVAVVGSRHPQTEQEAFAAKIGVYLAEKGLTLVTGGAAGIDRAAKNACLEQDGNAVLFVADTLAREKNHPRTLCICADGYDIPFSAPRALTRNRYIHIQAERTVAVQCANGTGGTWQGCTENLKHRWSELFVYDDGSAGAKALMERGAHPLTEPILPQYTNDISLF